jgi:hypothetical protein
LLEDLANDYITTKINISNASFPLPITDIIEAKWALLEIGKYQERVFHGHGKDGEDLKQLIGRSHTCF